jgi:hypothetical protein
VHCASRSTPWQTRVRFYPEEPLPKAKLLFIGTIHRAPKLEKHLKELLLESRPEVITIEISPYSLRYRRQKERHWLSQFEKIAAKQGLDLRNKGLALFYEALRMPYEVRASSEVAQILKIPLVPIDLNIYARRHLRELERILCPEGLKEMARSIPQTAEKELFLARFFLKEGLSPTLEEEDLQREAYMGRKIQKILSSKGVLRHVGGWRHLPGLLKRFPQAWGILLTGEGS